MDAEYEKMVKRKTAFLVRLLRQSGKNTPELREQARLAAQLIVRTDLLADEILNPHHSSVNVEITREGNTKETASPKEILYLGFAKQAQKALQALGLNTDSKERKTDNDKARNFMAELNAAMKDE